MAKAKLEYIWLDGHLPTQQMRSKTKVVDNFSGNVEDAPIWSFDGSSTNQAPGGSSDLLLKPVRVFVDPARDDADDERFEDHPFLLQGEGNGTGIAVALLQSVGDQHDDVPAIIAGRKIRPCLLKGERNRRGALGCEGAELVLDVAEVILPPERNDQLRIIAYLGRKPELVAIYAKPQLNVLHRLQAVEQAGEQFPGNVDLHVALPATIHALGCIQHK